VQKLCTPVKAHFRPQTVKPFQNTPQTQTPAHQKKARGKITTRDTEQPISHAPTGGQEPKISTSRALVKAVQALKSHPETRHAQALPQPGPGKDLYVSKIRNGTVIDHISAGHALDVLKILGIDGREGHVVSVAINVTSKTATKKDIVKVENRELKQDEVDKIALIAPGATINIIRDYEVAEKARVKLPETIKGIVRCANPACVSNAGEPVVPRFMVEKPDPLRLRCFYCSRFMEKPDVLKQF